jgi:hypothetical protein
MNSYPTLYRVLAAPPEPIREIDESSIELTYWLSPLFSPRELADIKDRVLVELNKSIKDASIYVEVKRGVDEAIIAHLHFPSPRNFSGLNELFRASCKKVLQDFLKVEPQAF